MAIFEIFKKRQSRQFHIPNRFYDPDKAEREEREVRIRREMGMADDEIETPEFKSSIAGAFRSRLSPRFNKKEDKTNSTVKILLFAFIMALAVLIYFKLN
jgi:hypothetical protein